LITQVEGTIEYNGHKLNEFEPRKTALYVSQNDLQAPELTVQETMDFSARYQGVGNRFGMF
jgi:ABC-type multidrug transport system ATPase subunit